MGSSASAFDGLPTLRFTGEDVLRMVEAGVLGEGDHVELLEGSLVEVVPEGPAHRARFTHIARAIEAVCPSGTHVITQAPVDISADTWPEPDIALVRGDVLDYEDHHPRGEDTLLVVEVAATSQAIDRQKASLYARAGIPVYWLVDLAARRVEVRTQPAGEEYRLTRILEPDEQLELADTPGRWQVSDLVG